MSGGTSVASGFMRQRCSQGYASSGDDLKDDACPRLCQTFEPCMRIYSLCAYSLIVPKSSTKSPSLSSLPCSFHFTTSNSTNLFFVHPVSLRSSTPPTPLPLVVPLTSATVAIALDAEPSPTTTTSLKSLPFQVSHGFDLHWLEPSYLLIIGGINIPHERGCKAHSDDEFQ